MGSEAVGTVTAARAGEVMTTPVVTVPPDTL
jgi:hypothetical protein